MSTELKLKDAGLQQKRKITTSGGKVQYCCEEICASVCLDMCGGMDILCTFTVHSTGGYIGAWSV